MAPPKRENAPPPTTTACEGGSGVGRRGPRGRSAPAARDERQGQDAEEDAQSLVGEADLRRRHLGDERRRRGRGDRGGAGRRAQLRRGGLGNRRVERRAGRADGEEERKGASHDCLKEGAVVDGSVAAIERTRGESASAASRGAQGSGRSARGGGGPCVDRRRPGSFSGAAAPWPTTNLSPRATGRGGGDRLTRGCSRVRLTYTSQRRRRARSRTRARAPAEGRTLASYADCDEADPVQAAHALPRRSTRQTSAAAAAGSARAKNSESG